MPLPYKLQSDKNETSRNYTSALVIACLPILVTMAEEKDAISQINFRVGNNSNIYGYSRKKNHLLKFSSNIYIWISELQLLAVSKGHNKEQ